jgi:hypothetical protein
MLMPRHYAMLLATPCAMPLMPSPRCAIFRRFFAAADLRYYFSPLFSLPLMRDAGAIFALLPPFRFRHSAPMATLCHVDAGVAVFASRHAILLADYLCRPDYAAFMRCRRRRRHFMPATRYALRRRHIACRCASSYCHDITATLLPLFAIIAIIAAAAESSYYY